MKRYFLSSDAKYLDEVMKLLGYEQVSNKKTIFKNLESFSYKSPNKKNIKLEKDYLPSSYIPFAFVIILIGIAFVVATTYLLLSIILKDNFDRLQYLFIMMFPAFLFILLGTAISIYRYFIELRNIRIKTAIPYIKKEVTKDVNN